MTIDVNTLGVMHNNRFIRLFIALLAIGLLASCGTATPTPAAKLAEGIRAVEPPVQLHEFALTNQQNQSVHLADLKGKASLITFGYTHCPDVCPINLANFKAVKTLLGEKASQVNFVFISVDGIRDTPDVLATHLKLFDPVFIGFTGDDASVRPVAQQFSVTYAMDGPTTGQTDYQVVHTASAFLVDKDGNLIRNYAFQTPPDVIASDIQRMAHLS